MQSKGSGKGPANPQKRMWGSKKKWNKELESKAATPVKPSGIKSPDKKRVEVRQTGVNTEIEPVAEENQMSVMQKRLEELDGEISYLMKDASRMWANQTWFNQQLIAAQRREAAQQYVFTGWNEIQDECIESDRDRVIEWALEQAGVSKFVDNISHRSQSEKMSPISIVTLKAAWQRQRLASYMSSISRSYGGISYWTADGQASNKLKIQGRVQICAFDRVMGLPLKAALEILGANQLGTEKVEKIWRYGELRASGNIVVKVKTDLEMGTCKVFVHTDLFEIFLMDWNRAWAKVTTIPKQTTKGDGKGGTKDAAQQIRVPFEIKLVKFKDHPEDDTEQPADEKAEQQL